jgi:formiminoglutamate deiminase
MAQNLPARPRRDAPQSGGLICRPPQLMMSRHHRRKGDVAKLSFEHLLTDSGWQKDVLVSCSAGSILSLEPEVSDWGQATRLRGFAVPGIGNVHSHTFQRGFAGLTERRGEGEDHFWTWRAEMYRFLDRLGPDDIEAIAALAFAEMLEAGYTAVAEFHYLHHQPDGHPYANLAELSQRIVAAAAQAGIALTLLPVFYAHGGFLGAPPEPGQRRFVCSLDLFAKLVGEAQQALSHLEYAELGIAPHSLRAVAESEIAELVAIHPAGPLHVHVAEQIKEVNDCLAATGARPVQWLLDRFDVSARWCLIHATHMTDEETRALAATGATAGLCPITESNLGDGIFPATSFIAGRGTFGLGTDSNVCISLVGEMRALEYTQRLRDRARNRLSQPNRSTGRFVFQEAARGGRQALNMRIGKIAPGYRADFVVLDGDDPILAGRDDDFVIDTWIFAAHRSLVRDVYVGGQAVVVDGRHRRRDAIVGRWRETMRRFAQR